MTKYKCGHTVELTIMDSSPMSISTWLSWKDATGFDGDKSLCFDCYCEKIKEQK